MWRHDKVHEDTSPVAVSQAGLISMNGPARALALETLRIRSLQTGAYVSHFKGRGMEFDESRPYQPGDDPRSIDWRVTARSTGAYTKLFREERERPVYIMLDLRRSMHFATRGCFKSVNASRAAAMLAWAAHHRGDRLGGVIFGDHSHRELKPKLGRQAALRFVHEIVGHPDWQAGEGAIDPAAALAKSMAALRQVTRPGSFVVVLSDFHSFGRQSQSYLAGIAGHNDVLAVWLVDPLEQALPPPGRYRLVSDAAELEIDTSGRRVRDDYQAAYQQRQHDLQAFCQRYNVHLLPLQTDDDPVQRLQQVLGKRVR